MKINTNISTDLQIHGVLKKSGALYPLIPSSSKLFKNNIFFSISVVVHVPLVKCQYWHYLTTGLTN